MDQGMETLLAILAFGAALVIASQLNNGRKRGDLRNYYLGKGQFFDTNSVLGNVRSLILGLFVCLVGWYLDEIGRWLWHQFGNELIVSPAKERWHRLVSTTMGLTLIVISLLQLIFIARDRRKQTKEAEIEQLRRFYIRQSGDSERTAEMRVPNGLPKKSMGSVSKSRESKGSASE